MHVFHRSILEPGKAKPLCPGFPPGAWKQLQELKVSYVCVLSYIKGATFTSFILSLRLLLFNLQSRLFKNTLLLPFFYGERALVRQCTQLEITQICCMLVHDNRKGSSKLQYIINREGINCIRLNLWWWAARSSRCNKPRRLLHQP